MDVAVVDYGMGNLHSVRNALLMVGAEVVVTSDPAELRRADRIVLPGVGAFGECVKNLRASGVLGTLEEEVLQKGKPMLGICVGMQVLASKGEELGEHEGLGWIPGRVRRFTVDETANLRVPPVPPGGHTSYIGRQGVCPGYEESLRGAPRRLSS